MTALREDVGKLISEIGSVDFLVGIPCYLNEATIGHVIEAVGEGLRKHYPHLKSLIVVSDGGSTDDSRERANSVLMPPGISKLITIYRGLPGKGSALRAVLEISELLEPRVVVLVDADLKSISPEWVWLLAEPVLNHNYDFVTPFYIRHKHDATITRLIAYPLTRAIFRKRVHQPIGGEFGFSGDVARYFAQQDVWDTDVAKFGIDIWLTITSINRGFRICQSRLGTKVHRGKDPANLGKMFREVTGTMFSLMEMHTDDWFNFEKSQRVDYFGERQEAEVELVCASVDELIDDMRAGCEHFGVLWSQILSPETHEDLIEICSMSAKKSGFSFPAELWARIVYDFAVSFRNWRQHKQKLVSMMTPLYYGRAAAFCKDADELDMKDTERAVEQQAEAFEDLKPYLAARAKP